MPIYQWTPQNIIFSISRISHGWAEVLQDCGQAIHNKWYFSSDINDIGKPIDQPNGKLILWVLVPVIFLLTEIGIRSKIIRFR